MTGHTVERRLAAILAADIVGFSRMMGQDEAGTLEAWKKCRSEHIDPAVRHHRGRIFKLMGDGILAEFASVVDAVRCAMAIQRGMAGEGDQPSKYGMSLRIAVNLGDVMIDGDDVYGDGVNVAARLQSIAQPGGVLVSEKVKAECSGKLDCSFVDAGAHTFKNIAGSVRVFNVRDPAGSGSLTHRIPARNWRLAASSLVVAILVGLGAWQSGWLPFNLGSGARSGVMAGRVSVVVLPFANLGGNAGEDWFADGITENITTSLSRIPDSFVIAYGTANAFKGKAADAKQIGQELGVRYLLQGSVLRSGNRMRVNAALIDTGSGGQIWADRFDYDAIDLLELENQIAGRIARVLDVRITEAESRRAGMVRADEQNAMDLTMQGNAILNRASLARSDLATARGYFEQALQLDERNWSAWLGVAMSHLLAVRFVVVDPDQLAQAERALARAQALAPDNPRVEYARGGLLFLQRRLQEAVSVLERTVALDRNYAPAHALLGAAKGSIGLEEVALEHVAYAVRLSPLDPRIGQWYFFIGGAYLHLGRYKDAVAVLEKSVAADPAGRTNLLFLAASLAQAGRTEEGRATMQRFLSLEPQMTLTRFKAREFSREPRFLRNRQLLYDGLLKAGLPE